MCRVSLLVMLAQLAMQITSWVSFIILIFVIIIKYIIQTILHLLSFILSILQYFTVGLIYSSICPSCQGRYEYDLSAFDNNHLTYRIPDHADQYGGHDDLPGYHPHTHTVCLTKVYIVITTVTAYIMHLSRIMLTMLGKCKITRKVS